MRLAPIQRALATRLSHAGCQVCPTTGALTPAIHPSSTFERDTDLDYPKGFVYARTANPTRHLLETVLADIETPLHATPGEALSFSSGVAAAHALFQSLPNGHVLLADDVYHGNRNLLTGIFEHWGVKVTTIDMTQLDRVAEALAKNDRENVVLWAETPSNPLLKVTDIEAVGALCHQFDVPFVVDATWLSCWNLQPLGLGADMVVHSTTKYYGGHSDLTGGAIVCSSTCKQSAQKLFDTSKFHQGAVGAVPSAFDSWLTLRGLRSLSARMDVHSKNAMHVATFLQSHPKVSQVHYPGLVEHPGHDIMTRQSRVMQEAAGGGEGGVGNRSKVNYGGMVSFQVAGKEKEAIRVVGGTEIFKRATSLGGTESLIEHRSSVEGKDTLTPTNLIRLSVGLECTDDLICDLNTALKSI